MFGRMIGGAAVMMLAALLVSDAAAQTASVRGFVTDSTSQQALQGASVALRTDGGALYGAATDGDGYFIVYRLPPGRYTLSVTFIGYAPYEEVLTLAAGASVQREIALSEEEAALGEVVVQAEGEKGITAVAAGLETVQPAQIERVPMPGVTGDLASYLQTVPGVVAQGDRGGQFFVRGGTLDQNLALLDGVPIYMPFHILNFYSAFPQEIIDNAAVYTGGFGARYGSRISSVIDVQARKGNKQRVAGQASLAPFMSTFQVEGPLIKNHVSFIGSVRQSLVDEVLGNLLGQRLRYRFGDQFGKLHTFIDAGNSFSITALRTHDRGDLAGTEKTFRGDNAPTVVDDSSVVTWENTLVGGRYVYISDFLPLLAEVTGGYSTMENAIGPEDASDRRAEVESYDAAGHFTLFLRDHELRFGGGWRRTTLRYELGGQFQAFESAEDELEEINGYLETDLGLFGGAVRVQPGLHLYALPRRSQQWIEPRVRALWRPEGLGGRVQFNAAWGLYHQALSGLNDERDVGNVFTAWVAVPETSPIPEAMHAIAGTTVQVAPWLSVAAEGFVKRLDRLAVPIFSAFPRFTTALQSAQGFARGVDVRLDVRDRALTEDLVVDGYISYAYSGIEYETAEIDYRPGHDRRHQVNALLHIQRGTLGATAQWQYGSGLPYTRSGGFDTWHLFTPDVDVAEDPGMVRVLYGEPYAGRQPPYYRLDLWLERRIERRRFAVMLRAGAVNVFNRPNLFYFDLFTLKRVEQLPVVPSVGFKVEWR